jgi:RNA polymerase sigma-70 factor, ECF subfamily
VLCATGPSTVTPGSGEEEVKLLRAKYGEVAQAAFERALESLDSRSRAVLRMHPTERTSIDGIAALYKTHRATAARWLVKMRAELFDRTRQELQLALALLPDEVTSLVRLLNPDLEVRLKSTRTGMPPRQRS